jgi:hypothetical protein
MKKKFFLLFVLLGAICSFNTETVNFGKTDEELEKIETLSIEYPSKWGAWRVFYKMKNLRRLALENIQFVNYDKKNIKMDHANINNISKAAAEKIEELELVGGAAGFASSQEEDFFGPFRRAGKLKKITFSSCFTNTEKVRTLDSLESLEFRCVKLNDFFFDELKKTCSSLPRCSSLRFMNTSPDLDMIDDGRLNSFMKVISSFKGLKHLKIIDSYLGGYDKKFSIFCSSLANCQELESLNIPGNRIFNNNGESQSNARNLNAALRKLKKLRCLDIRNNFRNSFFDNAVTITAFENLPHLKEVIISESESFDAVKAGLDSVGFYHVKTVDSDNEFEKREVWLNKNYADLSWAEDMSVDAFN